MAGLFGWWSANPGLPMSFHHLESPVVHITNPRLRSSERRILSIVLKTTLVGQRHGTTAAYLGVSSCKVMEVTCSVRASALSSCKLTAGILIVEDTMSKAHRVHSVIANHPFLPGYLGLNYFEAKILKCSDIRYAVTDEGCRMY